jgi:hypothetical protein
MGSGKDKSFQDYIRLLGLVPGEGKLSAEDKKQMSAQAARIAERIMAMDTPRKPVTK